MLAVPDCKVLENPFYGRLLRAEVSMAQLDGGSHMIGIMHDLRPSYASFRRTTASPPELLDLQPCCLHP